MMTTTRVLLLPGWLNSDPSYWQSRWESKLGFERVEQADWQWPRRGDWMARLDEVLLGDERATVLVAHSLGCQLVSGWAEHSQHTARVKGALLVAPPDTEREDTPPQLHNWRPIRRGRLPFPSIAVLSSNDPFCSLERGMQMAADWGSDVVLAGPRGHLNGKSGLGDWAEGQALIAPWIA
ncbi:alpha/beta hydrolase [Paucibacter sp. R3-3]|uniref:Alpha/beta hydrolase n=1 Tax=Roseateles agri TaxID=3098619 RepID=A0ABU5DF15_9BURK|nr:alpha/beta hydrolase [Paucibacter sp. R3-3]MDY0744744.1 alpha/beta hydrolase [Paucibacter sp. R3-3]